jgi:hypothetical protein
MSQTKESLFFFFFFFFFFFYGAPMAGVTVCTSAMLALEFPTCTYNDARYP